MNKKNTFRLLTFYKFIYVPDPRDEVKKLKRFCTDIGMRGRIYIGEEGINAQCSANPGQKQALIFYLNNHPLFNEIEDMETKETLVDAHKFPKMIVRYRKEIVALGITYKSNNIDKAKYKMSIDNFKDVIDKRDPSDYMILDMRNNYEYNLGHFKNAFPAGTKTLKETEQFIEEYRSEAGDKEIIMYCTGGIRCEKLAVMLRNSGMENVKQLDGGVIKYVNRFDDGNWLGNLYTFDDRVSTYVGSEDTHTMIGKCHYSGIPAEDMYNCRYGVCNKQIIADPAQYKKHLGFCSNSCWKSAADDLNIRDWKLDKMNYKHIRSRIKKGELSNSEASKLVYDHLNKKLHDILFNYPEPVADIITVNREAE